MANWVTESLDDFGEHIVRADLRRNGYLYFPQKEVQVQVQLNIEQDAQLDDKVDISDCNNSSADETLMIQHPKHLITTTNNKNIRTTHCNKFRNSHLI